MKLSESSGWITREITPPESTMSPDNAGWPWGWALRPQSRVTGAQPLQEIWQIKSDPSPEHDQPEGDAGEEPSLVDQTT
jgi:hypothetical protein